MLLAYLKRLFTGPQTEAEYIAECDRACRKMTGKGLTDHPPWNFGMAYEDGIPPKYAVKEMLERAE